MTLRYFQLGANRKLSRLALRRYHLCFPNYRSDVTPSLLVGGIFLVQRGTLSGRGLQRLLPRIDAVGDLGARGQDLTLPSRNGACPEPSFQLLTMPIQGKTEGNGRQDSRPRRCQ